MLTNPSLSDNFVIDELAKFHNNPLNYQLNLSSGLNYSTNEFNFLYQAIKLTNCLDFIKAILKQTSGLINPSTYNSDICIHLAIKQKKEPLIKLLIENQADLDISDEHCEHALLKAIKVSISNEIIDLIINNTKNLNKKNINKVTALHLAIINNNFFAVEQLLKKQVKINSQDTYLNTPLHYAACQKDSRFVLSLLTKGADLRITNDDHLSPLSLAVITDNFESANILIQNNANLNNQDKNGNTALHIALSKKNDSIIKLLNSTNLILLNNNKQSVLHLAATNDYLPMIELIISRNFNLNIQDQNGNTALHLAALNNAINSFKLLLKSNARLDIYNYYGMGIIHILVINNKAELLTSLLLSFRQLVDHRTSKGMTAIHYALKLGNIDIVDLLIKSNSNLQLQDENSLDVLDYAILSKDYKKNIDYLTRAKYKININKLTKNNCSFIHTEISSKQPNIDKIQYLIELGIDIDIQNNQKKTALDIAIEQENIDIIKLLLINSAIIQQYSDQITDYSSIYHQNILVISLTVDKLYRMDYNETMMININLCFKDINNNTDYPDLFLKRFSSHLKKYGISSQLTGFIHSLTCKQYIKEQLNEIINKELIDLDKISSKIEDDLAILLNLKYPEQFPLSYPYSKLTNNEQELNNYFGQYSFDLIRYKNTYTSYIELPNFIPCNFFYFLTSKENFKEAASLLIIDKQIGQNIINSFDKLNLNYIQKTNFSFFKQRYYNFCLGRDDLNNSINEQSAQISTQQEKIIQLEDELAQSQFRVKLLEDQLSQKLTTNSLDNNPLANHLPSAKFLFDFTKGPKSYFEREVKRRKLSQSCEFIAI